ncbi:M48 family metalloprotease, partial [uncultured Cardiobacterium sp.]|uniref:M48 family metalloprotease n=1 Tax=uncultured Cardiobacterium sp. TaxID=417619 RepID=UPI002612D0BF
MTNFREKHRQAAASSRRLNLAFWLAALASYLSYSLACALTLFGISPLIAVYSGQHFVSRYLWLSLAFGLVPTGIMLLAYSDARRKMRERSAGEQARALGAEPTRDNSARDRRYTNLVAEMSAASGNPPPETFIQRHDLSINAFILGGADDTLALTISQGALDSLTRDELQAVIAHEYGHIENGDLALYSQLTAILHGYYIISEWQNQQDRIHTAPEANLFDLRGLLANEQGYSYTGGILALFGSIHYLCGRLLQAAFSRQREHMADARAVQYTRHPDALIGALKKALALQHNGVRLLRPPLDRAHIYFIYYQSAQNRLLRTHPPLRERIQSWGGGDVSERELDAILFDIQQQARDQYETNPVQRGKSALTSTATYPLISLDRTLAAQHYPAPADPAAALLALYIYHSGASPFDIEQNRVIPLETLDAARPALNTIEHAAPLAQIPLLGHLTRATATLSEAQKNTLEQHIQRLIKLDKHLSRYELAAYICWRASRHPAGNDSNYRAQRDAIIYLYDYLISDAPDDDEAQENYQRLWTSSLPLDAPPHTALDTQDAKTGLQLCRHLEALRQLDVTYRKVLLDAI